MFCYPLEGAVELVSGCSWILLASSKCSWSFGESAIASLKGSCSWNVLGACMQSLVKKQPCYGPE